MGLKVQAERKEEPNFVSLKGELTFSTRLEVAIMVFNKLIQKRFLD